MVNGVGSYFVEMSRRIDNFFSFFLTGMVACKCSGVLFRCSKRVAKERSNVF